MLNEEEASKYVYDSVLKSLIKNGIPQDVAEDLLNRTAELVELHTQIREQENRDETP